MRELTLRQVPPNTELRSALLAAGLPLDDLDEGGRVYFEYWDPEGHLMGFSGLEQCGKDFLLRSMVVLPEFRSRGFGRELAAATIARVPSAADIYLATTTAAAFFERLGFEVVTRNNVPEAILSTRQLSGICPASATIMNLNRPPT